MHSLSEGSPVRTAKSRDSAVHGLCYHSHSGKRPDALLQKNLADLQEKSRGEHPLGTLAGSQWIEVLCRSIKSTIVEKDWSTAFSDNGLSVLFDCMRPRLMQLFQVHVPLPPGPPDDRDIEMILGRKRALLRDQVLRASTRAAARKMTLRLPGSARLPSAGPGRCSIRCCVQFELRCTASTATTGRLTSLAVIRCTFDPCRLSVLMLDADKQRTAYVITTPKVSCT